MEEISKKISWEFNACKKKKKSNGKAMQQSQLDKK